MAITTVNYSANATITMDLINLASSATLVAGRESSEIDNTTNKYLDALVQGVVSVGTTPTANTTISIYVYGSDRSLTTAGAWPTGGVLDSGSPTGGLDGVDSAETLTNSGVLYSMLKLGAIINVLVNTSDVAYYVAPFSVAQLFGGVMPQFWGLYVAHNTGVNLRNNAVNTNSFRYAGIKYDIA
jgi:hypothetical protein